ncbi:MAG: hypothetical protein ABUS51_10840, partial [Acidobacteriota bacterium]
FRGINMFYLGLDLGQRRDHSAICVVEKVEAGQAFQAPVYRELLVRHLERAPLGTPYPGVVRRVRQIVTNEELAGQCGVVVDATGVGAPVVEMLREARLGCEVAAVTITGGLKESQAGQAFSVPKRDLMAGVQVLLERGELRIARGLREAGALVRELMDVRATLRESGAVRMGADGCGEHDDLVIALALACWRARRGRAVNGCVPHRLPGI